MNDIREIHEKVLAFLLNWREQRDKDLLFTLRRRPPERLQSGMWFLGNEYYLAFSFWTGTDWVNKTQNIYIEISQSGTFSIRFSAKDDPNKAKVLGFAASVLGGFPRSKKPGYLGDVWTKEYEGTDYLKNLEIFLSEDKGRIDTLLENQRSLGYSSAFDKALNRLNPVYFEQSLAEIQKLRQANLPTARPQIPEAKELVITELVVTNAGLFDKCAIRFGTRATCLIGENGGGKTTLLRAAALGLVGTGSPLVDTKISLQNLPKIAGVDDKFALRYAGSGSIGVSYLFNGKVFENGKANLIPFQPQPDTGEVEFNNDRIEEDGFGLPIGEEGMDGDGELPILVIGYPQRYGKKPDGTDIKKRSPKPNAYDIIPLILDTEDNRIESLKLWISETWNQEDGAHRSKVNALFDIISAVLSRDGEPPFTLQVKSAISYRKIAVTTPFNPEGLPFDLLSTGLSNLFGWIGHLISRMHEAYPDAEDPLSEPAVVFVDEVDNYLHPLVQARAVPVLLEKFPKVQFVLTSHSPVMLAALPKNQVRAYRVENGAAQEIQHFYGRTVQDILLSEYGINKRPATEVQRQIDQMFREIALENEMKAKTIFDQLAPILGPKDPAIEDAQYDLNELANATH